MDLRDAFNVAMTLVAFLGGWLVKTMRDDIRELKETDSRLADAVNNLRVDLPEKYVHKDEFRASLTPIHEILRRIEDKLDRKVDK